MIKLYIPLVPECGQPPSPGERGVVMYNSTLLGFRAVYSCEDGYQLEPRGGMERECLLNGNWSGEDLTCTSELIFCFICMWHYFTCSQLYVIKVLQTTNNYT